MSLKDTLRRAAGLLVEIPEDESIPDSPPPATPVADIDRRLAELDSQINQLEGRTPSPAPQAPVRTVEQIVRDSPGPNLDEIKVAAAAPPPAPSPDGKFDFTPIYQHANLPPAPFSCEQMLEILQSLPAELPLEMKRQTVKVTLGAMGKSIGATPETIVADTSRKLAALADYEENVNKKAVEYATKAQLEVAALEKQIEEKKASIETTQQKAAQITANCTDESNRLDDVLEFFSLDVAPSKHAVPESSPPAQPS